MKQDLIKSPVLVNFYNRPKKTKQILKILSKIRFKKLYFKLDGPKNKVDKLKINKSYEYLKKFKKNYGSNVKIIKEKKKFRHTSKYVTVY